MDTLRRFEKLFFLKKAHKVVIKIDSYDEIALMFDIQNQYFYFVEGFIPHPQSNFVGLIVKYTVDKDDLIYRYYGNFTNGKHEIRTFQYFNDKMVDVGLKWNESVSSIEKKYWVSCICIV